MSKKQPIDEGVASLLFRFFMKATGVDRKILRNPGVRQAMKDAAKAASDFNAKMDELEELTGQDYSHIKFKRR